MMAESQTAGSQIHAVWPIQWNLYKTPAALSVWVAGDIGDALVDILITLFIHEKIYQVHW